MHWCVDVYMRMCLHVCAGVGARACVVALACVGVFVCVGGGDLHLRNRNPSALYT